jgi:hypothetical protein
MAVRGRPRLVLRPARREAALSDRSDLFPARHKTGGGGGAAITFLWRLSPIAHHCAQSASALSVGELARNIDTICSAIRGYGSGGGREHKG